MTGAMYAAISGLKAHMNKLNVIGNNIANVNTDGFKSGRVVFEDALYTTSKSGSNGSSVAGSVNPSQIGYGVNISTIDLDMSRGNYRPTGIDSDIYLDAEGFFVLGDKETGNNIDPNNPDSLKRFTFSRVGHIEFKSDNYLTDGNGNVIYGFMCVGYEDITDPNDQNVVIGKKPIFSDQLVPLRFPKQEIGADGSIEVKYPVADENGKLIDAYGGTEDDPTELPFVRVDTINVDRATGRITAVTKDSSDPIIVGYIAVGNVTNPGGMTHVSGPYFQAGDGAGEVSISLMGNAGPDAGIYYVNGSLANTGNNPGGGGNQGGGFPPNATTGPAGMFVGGNGTGQFISGGLEQSKTDLATEISEMITTQRGYQANTRIITVTDSMLEELVNIKR